MRQRESDGPMRRRIFDRVLADGLFVVDLPEIAYASGLLTDMLVALDPMQAPLGARSRLRRLVSSETAHAGFDEAFSVKVGELYSMRGLTLRDVAVRAGSEFDDDFAKCVIVGPLAERSIIEGLSRRLGLECPLDQEAVVRAPDARLRQVYRDFLCFARPRSRDGAPLRIATCAVETAVRSAELAQAVGGAVQIELVDLDRLMAAWRRSGDETLSEDANALVREAERITIFQPRFEGMIDGPRGGSFEQAIAGGYFGSPEAARLGLASIGWAPRILKSDSDGSSELYLIESSLDADDEATEETVSEDNPLIALFRRMLGQARDHGSEWIELRVEERRAGLRIRCGGTGWSSDMDTLRMEMVPVMHATLCDCFGVSPESGGQGRIETPWPNAAALHVEAWIASKAAILRAAPGGYGVAQLRLLPTSGGGGIESVPRVDAIAGSIAAHAEEERHARIVLVSTDSDAAMHELCGMLRARRPFSNLAFMNLDPGASVRAPSRTSALAAAERRLEQLRSFDPVAPTLVSFGEMSEASEAEEVLRLALAGCYVLVRVPATSLHLAIMRFLASGADRQIAAALLLSSVHIRDARMHEFPATPTSSGNPQKRICSSVWPYPVSEVRTFAISNIDAQLRESLSAPLSIGELRRRASVEEHTIVRTGAAEASPES